MSLRGHWTFVAFCHKTTSLCKADAYRQNTIKVVYDAKNGLHDSVLKQFDQGEISLSYFKMPLRSRAQTSGLRKAFLKVISQVENGTDCRSLCHPYSLIMYLLYRHHVSKTAMAASQRPLISRQAINDFVRWNWPYLQQVTKLIHTSSEKLKGQKFSFTPLQGSAHFPEEYLWFVKVNEQPLTEDRKGERERFGVSMTEKNPYNKLLLLTSKMEFCPFPMKSRAVKQGKTLTVMMTSRAQVYHRLQLN